MKVIDLSQSLENVIFDKDPKIKYIDHKKGGNILGMVSIMDTSFVKMFINGICYALGVKKINHKDFPDKQGLAWEYFKSDTHSGTHLDAPYHFGSYVQNQKAKTIDEIPLEWCISDGIVLNLSHIEEDQIGVEHIQIELKRVSYSLKPFDIVLIYTGASKYWNTKKYPSAHKSLHPDAISWIIDQGVKIIAIDAFTIDQPFKKMLDSYHTTKDQKHLWPGHFVGRTKEYLHIENAANLEELLDNPTGYIVSCVPVKIKRGSAGWTRLIAISKNDIQIQYEKK